uniref:Uncharacterized protein TCIL3000_11_6730 n=1 Tax=Trypanosoma congolense (strain IL3000) TaxID=1068625 RepID=G0V0S6_TRYCI|nr:unnamed protein product [Trypanosoma congolense IL3000]
MKIIMKKWARNTAKAAGHGTSSSSIALRSDRLAVERNLRRALLTSSAYLLHAVDGVCHLARSAECHLCEVRAKGGNGLADNAGLHAGVHHLLLVHRLRLVGRVAVLRCHHYAITLRLHYSSLCIQETSLALRPVPVIVERVVAQADAIALLQKFAVLANKQPLEVCGVHHYFSHPTAQRATATEVEGREKGSQEQGAVDVSN